MTFNYFLFYALCEKIRRFRQTVFEILTFSWSQSKHFFAFSGISLFISLKIEKFIKSSKMLQITPFFDRKCILMDIFRKKLIFWKISIFPQVIEDLSILRIFEDFGRSNAQKSRLNIIFVCAFLFHTILHSKSFRLSI